MGVVRVGCSEVRLVVVNFLICLTEEIVESVPSDCRILSKCFADLVAYSMRAFLVGLTFAASREVESPGLTLVPIVLLAQKEVFLPWVKFRLLFQILLFR